MELKNYGAYGPQYIFKLSNGETLNIHMEPEVSAGEAVICVSEDIEIEDMQKLLALSGKKNFVWTYQDKDGVPQMVSAEYIAEDTKYYINNPEYQDEILTAGVREYRTFDVSQSETLLYDESTDEYHLFKVKGQRNYRKDPSKSPSFREIEDGISAYEMFPTSNACPPCECYEAMSEETDIDILPLCEDIEDEAAGEVALTA